jgi:hypothetical protein
MNIRRALSSFVAAGLLAFVINGCAKDSTPPVTAGQGSSAAAATNVVASGTALPEGYKIDPGRTMVFGTDERWTGRLSYTTSLSADDVFDFLHREMPNFGWAEIAAMRSGTSLLTFTSDATSRIATIQIERGGMGATTRVEMVVMPETPHPPHASTGGYPPPAPSQAPRAPH